MMLGSSLPDVVAKLWLAALRYVAPVAILLVFASTLGWIKF